MSSHSDEDTQQFELEQNRATCAGLAEDLAYLNLKWKKKQHKNKKEQNKLKKNYKKEKWLLPLNMKI